MERTAAGELKRAVAAKTLALSADSEAIVRLASMDGYDVPSVQAEAQTTGEPDMAHGPGTTTDGDKVSA